MKEAVLVYEENHGLVCVADSLRAAVVNLVERRWITEKTEFYDEETHHTWQPLSYFMGTDNPREDEMVDFIVQKVEAGDDAFFDGCFYFVLHQPVATRTACCAAVEYTIYDADADKWLIIDKHFDTLEDAFRYAAKLEAFSDCTDEVLMGVHCGDQEYHYAGWRPGMEITFIDRDGDEVWSNCFPEWDH